MRKPVILVVEDDFLIRISVADDLRSHGFTVLEAASADDALRLLESGDRIHLVFSDIQMPGQIDGLGLFEVMRERFPATPVILTSGNTPATVALQHDGIFVPKPYDIDRVTSLIRKVLGRATGDAVKATFLGTDPDSADGEPRVG